MKDLESSVIHDLCFTIYSKGVFLGKRVVTYGTCGDRWLSSVTGRYWRFCFVFHCEWQYCQILLGVLLSCDGCSVF